MISLVMEKTTSRGRLAGTNSVEELASFRDHHDLTDFEDAMEAANEPETVPTRRCASLRSQRARGY
jgi:hypothetical protein